MIYLNQLALWCKELRVKHWLKNGLVFLPLFFSGKLLQTSLFFLAGGGALVFCLLSSAVYLINDLADLMADRQQKIKRQRPLAAGSIGKRQALTMSLLLLLAAGALQTYLLYQGRLQNHIQEQKYIIWIILISYLFINLLYSWCLKKIPVIDVGLLSAGFMLRLYYGGAIVGVRISAWLTLTVLTMALYLSLGKRQKEAVHDGAELRQVLKYYRPQNLRDGMSLCLILTLLFYFLWTLDPGTGTDTAAALKGSNVGIECLPATFFLVILICWRYEQNLKWSLYGDPVEIFFSDHWLQIFFLVYALSLLALIY